MLAWRCKRYSALPRAGGVDDQPAGLLDRMSAAALYHDAIALQSRLSATEFKRHTNHYAAWQDVIRLRMSGGDDG